MLPQLLQGKIYLKVNVELLPIDIYQDPEVIFPGRNQPYVEFQRTKSEAVAPAAQLGVISNLLLAALVTVTV